jgi:hypothetical protein
MEYQNENNLLYSKPTASENAINIGTMSHGGLRKGSKILDLRPNTNKSFTKSNMASTKSIVAIPTKIDRAHLCECFGFLSLER